MKARSAEGKEVVLVSAEAFPDPGSRAALVSVLRGSRKVMKKHRSVRMIWKPPGSDLAAALKALVAELEAADIRVDLFEPQTDGTVVVEIACP
jgi:hypothetical protein